MFTSLFLDFSLTTGGPRDESGWKLLVDEGVDDPTQVIDRELYNRDEIPNGVTFSHEETRYSTGERSLRV